MIEENEMKRSAMNLLRHMSRIGDDLVDVPGIRGWVGAAAWGIMVRMAARAAGVHIGLVVIEPDGDGGDEDEVDPIVRDNVPETEQRMDLH